MAEPWRRPPEASRGALEKLEIEGRQAVPGRQRRATETNTSARAESAACRAARMACPSWRRGVVVSSMAGRRAKWRSGGNEKAIVLRYSINIRRRKLWLAANRSSARNEVVDHVVGDI